MSEEDTNSDPNFMNIIITDDESWVYRYDPETKSSHHFPYNENPTRALNTTYSNADRHQVIGRKNSRMHMTVHGCLMQARFIETHQIFTQKNVGYFSNRVICWFRILKLEYNINDLRTSLYEAWEARITVVILVTVEIEGVQLPGAGGSEVSVITKAEEGQHFVSIDGKRTYINLFGSTSDQGSIAPTHTQDHATQKQSSSVIGTG